MSQTPLPSSTPPSRDSRAQELRLERQAAREAKKARNRAAHAAKQAARNGARKAGGAPPPVRDSALREWDEPPPAELPGHAFYADFNNFETFCRDCLVIITKQGERKPFILNSTQKQILRAIRRLISKGIPPRIVVLKARQVGVSTLIEAILFWDCLVRPNRSSLVVAHTLKSSRALFRMSRNFHRFLQGGALEQATRIQNIHEIEFDSGSRMQVEVQGDPRGYTAQQVHLSEFGFYEEPEATLTAIMQTVPMTTDSLAVIESTANGVGNKLHKLWQRAVGLSMDKDIPEDEKGWTPIFIPWFRHEEYELPAEERHFRFTGDETRLMRDHPEVTRQKLKWRRWCISSNLDGDEDKFAQEYPATDQEAFSVSGRPAFDIEGINHYTRVLNNRIQGDGLPPKCEIETNQTTGIPEIVVQDRGRLRIFFEPEKRHTYIVGADPSEGDPGSDPSPLAVLDQQTMNAAATWYGKAPPDVLAMYAIDLAKHYNEGLIINEANNHGILFQETVIQSGYPNLYYRQVSEESVAREVTEKPGYLATRRNREYLFNTLRKYVRMRMGEILCPHMVQQIQTLIYIDDKVQAGVGSEKDLLVAFGLCLMAHRGSMSNPLEPHPEALVRSVATAAQLIKERQGPERALEYVHGLTGMSMDEVLKMQDAADQREKLQRKFGLGGLR